MEMRDRLIVDRVVVDDTAYIVYFAHAPAYLEYGDNLPPGGRWVEEENTPHLVVDESTHLEIAEHLDLYAKIIEAWKRQ